ncbi:MAG: bifunctional 23S rRNA (guanine(2069)-N(7))-methyltransferase RlmK/23S rRNA (guanine(2445)-N(2))-methyltransferase RlmL [Gammaproteobacteria bacterium]|nr:MAG: bifunctional 23S rRNA (guanine(2069)-N(7))-methyltransferase RlmK/23S rRNA (guanine(2445)-N(2))-methyltransferase RlmL [Gammaproteobacteria bacterium]
MLDIYVTCAAAVAPVLVRELGALGIVRVQEAGAGVRVNGRLETAYRICLESRVADRVLLPIHKGKAVDAEALYALVREVDWSQHLSVDGTLAVDFYSSSSTITHTRYGALKVKDAIVDQFREREGRRPSVDRFAPDVRINVYLFRNRARIAIDLSGGALHRRGYRHVHKGRRHLAPLKENLAAALLIHAGWPEALESGVALADPLCGSGTLVCEALLMARHEAPGLLREHFGFTGWKGHDAALWQGLLDAAQRRRRVSPVPIFGSDIDARAIAEAKASLAFLGAEDEVTLAVADVLSDGAGSASLPGERSDGSESERVPADLPARFDDLPAHGLVVGNLPYGNRLERQSGFMQGLELALSKRFAGWRYGLLMPAESRLALLPVEHSLALANGGIDCRFRVGAVPSKRAGSGEPSVAAAASVAAEPPPSAAIDIEGFANRVKKNLARLKGWRREQDITAFRLYDADLPEFAVAIDVHDTEDAGRQVVLQEYRAPASVNAAMAASRLSAVIAVLPELLSIEPVSLHVKERSRQRGSEQYRRDTAAPGITATLREGNCRFILNFSDYLDTGLFIDHRRIRRHFTEIAKGRRVLNLFAYTGSVSVAAGVGGADETLSVDLSANYCRWAERNLALNGLDAAAGHRVLRADVPTWLQEAGAEWHEHFDLVFLDPPTFSNSSRTDKDWSVQDHHAGAIRDVLQLLAPGGTLVFSCNYRKFRLDDAIAGGLDGSLEVEDRTDWSIDRDFHRQRPVHRCWFLRKRDSRQAQQ